MATTKKLFKYVNSEKVPMTEQEQDETLTMWASNSGKTKEELLEENGA